MAVTSSQFVIRLFVSIARTIGLWDHVIREFRVAVVVARVCWGAGEEAMVMIWKDNIFWLQKWLLSRFFEFMRGTNKLSNDAKEFSIMENSFDSISPIKYDRGFDVVFIRSAPIYRVFEYLGRYASNVQQDDKRLDFICTTSNCTVRY